MDVIGLPIDDFVSKQIGIRQKKLAESIRTSEILLATNANKPWLRAASSVDLKASYLQELGLDEAKYGGSLLAKQVVLQNSVTDYSNITSPLQLGGYAAYEFFYDPKYGPKPPPGIESFSVSHINNGSIRQGTLRIKCFTPKQFDIILALYVRIGYTMLIEWGHTAFFKNSGQFASQAEVNTAGVLDSFLNGTKSFEDLLKEIREERIKSDGNYNGFLGRVVNFTFSNTSGVYDIDIKLITQGAIIESLVISNTTTFGNTSENKDQQSTAAQRSRLTQELNSLIPGTKNPLKDIKDQKIDVHPNDGQIQYPVIGVTTASTEKDYYIKFGLLLKKIQEFCLVYDKKGNPVVRVWPGEKKILIQTMPLMTSGDLSVCFLAPNPDQSQGISVGAASAEVCKAFRDTGSIFLGDLYHLYINYKFIEQVFDRSVDMKGNLTLFKLVNDIVQGIQFALGNVNNLVVTYDEELNRIDVIDKSRVTGKRDVQSRESIYLGGVLTGSFGSFVKKAELQSEVPNSLQQLAAIGATNNFSTKGDVTLFSLMNSGSEDRIIGKLKEQQQPQEVEEDPGVNTDLWGKYVSDCYATYTYSEEFRVPFRQLNIDLQTRTKQLLTLSTAKNPSKFIPFNLKLDLQGISGFKLLQEIKVNDGGANIVPFYLKKNFTFVLKEVNDQITDTGWTTSLGTFVVSVDRDSDKYGKNTYTRAFKQVTGGRASTTGTSDVFIRNQQRFVAAFIQSPWEWSDVQIAGVMGVINFESRFDSAIQNQAGGSAYGLCQWTGSRLTSLKAFAAAQPGRITPAYLETANTTNFLSGGIFKQGLSSDFDIQILFLQAELLGTQSGGYYKNLKVNEKIKAARTVEEAVLVWLELFEGIPRTVKGKPNPEFQKQGFLTKRIAFANDFLARMALETNNAENSLYRGSTKVTRFIGSSLYKAY